VHILIVQGLASAASAGMLLYISLVQLVAEHNKYVALQYASAAASTTAGGAEAAGFGPGQPSALPLGPSAVLGQAPPRNQRLCFVPGTVMLSHMSLVAGGALMWLLAFWA
jgi:hypothetical protein